MGIRVEHGDSREILRGFADCSISACVTDPPYSLVSIQKRFGKPGAAEAKDRDGLYRRASAGFMGQQWDTGETAHDPAFWAEVLRVLKPGAHLLAFGGTRTQHRMVCAIEDAGFEIRDTIQWLYASGFPKSHNQKDEWQGWGTALKPANEPICLARKPLSEKTIAANVLRWGTGAINIEACRIGVGDGGNREGEASAARRYTQEGATNFAAMPGPRGGDTRGRWPANVIHDGSDEVISAFPLAPGQQGALTGNEPSKTFSGKIYGEMRRPSSACEPRPDAGTAGRFFYSAKADSGDRLGSKHPTVKPVDLMAYLVRLVTPPTGTVLDPFAGSGTTGMACMREGFDCVLIEREAEYVADIRQRLAHVSGADTPLFGGA